MASVCLDELKSELKSEPERELESKFEYAQRDTVAVSTLI